METTYNRRGHHVSGAEFDGEKLSEYKGIHNSEVEDRMTAEASVEEKKFNERKYGNSIYLYKRKVHLQGIESDNTLNNF